MLRTLALTAAGATLLALAATPQATADDPHWLAKRLVKTVNAKTASRHLHALQRIANAHNGVRNAGAPGHEASAKYVKDHLTAAGYRVTYQEFPFTDFDFLAQSLTEVSPTPRTLHPYLARFSVSTPEGGISAPLAVVPNDGCTASDYSAAKGRIALIRGGGHCTNTVKQKVAGEAGAVAALINSNQPARDMNLRTRLVAANARIPTATLSLNEADRLAGDATKGPVTLRLDLRGKARDAKTFNVIAETPTGRADNTVMVGAHLDGVTEGPGINDNGSSVSMLLDTALSLRPHWKKLPNKVRFAWWSAEEHGLLGSTYYVSRLSERERLDHALYLNFDMIGSPNFARMVYDGDGSDPGSPKPGPYGSAQIEKVFLDFFASRHQPTVARVFDGRSDYGPFIAVGIPAGGATSGSNLVKTPEWQRLFGGVAGQPTDWCYHQHCDNVGNVNRTIYDQLGDSIAWTVGRFAVNTSDITGERSARAAAARRHLPFVPDDADE